MGGTALLIFEAPHDFCIRIEPINHRDDGEVIRSLSREIILAAAETLKDWKP